MVSELLFKTLLKKKDSLLKDCLAQEKYDTLNEDAKEVMVLKYLPLLLKSPLIKAKPKHWKPSKRELIDGFVLFIHDISDLNKKIEKRQTKCEQFKIPVQPIPIVVGPYGHCQCFVSVDDVLYGVENPIKAIDVCFKIYHALNAKYPADAEPSWLFLQKAIYKIFTSQDPKFSSVDILIADIKAEQ
ncbi:hypothetical protein ILUMI_15775 [Ignelater luminosus]|uniref:Uncharacterized protein n=1 Tax=Ignelater luminosus TaxID=2038154 RepID=A0A8K0G9K6_IGNLU|nr:hypothetical protein ILUMI_15775 [Ignelater luminosus]